MVYYLVVHWEKSFLISAFYEAIIKRDRLVDFSFSYSSTRTRLLTTKDKDFWDANSLAEQRISVLPKTTSERTIKRVQPLAEIYFLALLI